MAQQLAALYMLVLSNNRCQDLSPLHSSQSFGNQSLLTSLYIIAVILGLENSKGSLKAAICRLLGLVGAYLHLPPHPVSLCCLPGLVCAVNPALQRHALAMSH